MSNFSSDYSITAVDVEAGGRRGAPGTRTRRRRSYEEPRLGNQPGLSIKTVGIECEDGRFRKPLGLPVEHKQITAANDPITIPSAQEDRVWLAILDPTSPATIRALKAVREVDTDGSITQPDIAPPQGRWPAGATDRGLLFQGDASIDLWDPHTQTIVETLPAPFAVAVSKHRIATCGKPCVTLRLHDLEQGTERLVAPPDGIARIDGYGGAFSPDGRYMAAVGFDHSGIFSEQTAVSLVLIDFVEATARTVPNSLTRPWDYPQVTWSASGDWLFFTNGPTLLAVEPAEAEAYEVDVELVGPYGMAAR